MHLNEYQREAKLTDQFSSSEDARIIPLLGMAGEVGTLLSEYKKFLRDGRAHLQFRERLSEDLGDILWYVASTASAFEFELNDIALENIEKTRNRWSVPPVVDGERDLYDENVPECEQLPRRMDVRFEDRVIEGETKAVMIWQGEEIGDPLTDNAHEQDFYRYHDVFHLACAGFLGWSPVLRRILKRKRKSNSTIDNNEDGARASIIEELISQLVFEYAQAHDLLRDVGSLDYSLLKTIQMLVSGREVRDRTLWEWEALILACYDVWRQLIENRGGVVRVDLLEGKLGYVGADSA